MGCLRTDFFRKKIEEYIVCIKMVDFDYLSTDVLRFRNLVLQIQTEVYSKEARLKHKTKLYYTIYTQEGHTKKKNNASKKHPQHSKEHCVVLYVLVGRYLTFGQVNQNFKN